MHCSYFCRNNIKIRECFLPTLKSSLWTRLNLRNQNLQTIYVTVRIGIRNFPWSQTDPTLLSFNLEIPEVWRISLVTFSFIIIRRQVSRLTPAMKLSFSPFRPLSIQNQVRCEVSACQNDPIRIVTLLRGSYCLVGYIKQKKTFQGRKRFATDDGWCFIPSMFCYPM